MPNSYKLTPMIQPTADFEQALRLQRQGDFAAAALIFERLLDADPQRMMIWGYLALAYLETNRGALALETIDKALSRAPKEINLYMQRAYICKRLNQTEQAIQHYQQVLALNPNYAKAHNNLAGEYAASDNYPLALQHYRHALHADPALVPAHLNLGLLLLKRGEWLAAETQFRNVIALDAEHSVAYFYLGTLYLEMNQLDQAEEALRMLLSKMPEHIEGWVNRGVVALKQKQEQTAIDYFTQALILDNHHREARNNMAATLIHFDRYELALQYYAELLREEPQNVEYIYNSGIAQMGLGHIQSAEQLFQQVLNLDSKHFGALSNLAAIQMRLGNRPAACDLLERALAIQPQDAASQFMLQALRGVRRDQQACPAYVQDLFNHYAIHYDSHMQNVLDYGVPKRLWTLLHQNEKRSYRRALDLGCGTGLSGMILRPLSHHLTGVDLAAKMLAVARGKNIYDDLIEAELLGYLQNDMESFDLVVAADVLPYLGDLSPVLAAIHARLAPEGIVWFTTEISTQEPWLLQSTMRFCHHADYVTQVCAQQHYTVMHQETLVARQQDEQDLYVNLFGLQKLNV
jgi:predicted TPR repeat methyltransferase/thioredoxin-like negative regulator of GroEL